ncbi:hypothetical protein AMTR_s00052p00149550 [Amborella trichopoda]|uniref:Uncharacterized protein n=1 Tax=Amborella trichopoda TaxID=13333 RepID=U5D7R4_AMBTC|nr:hypothetical protein AMTR_s00052p00149550 [Amborella trichopoda]
MRRLCAAGEVAALFLLWSAFLPECLLLLEASTKATSSRYPAQEGGIRKADHYIGILGNANYKTTID